MGQENKPTPSPGPQLSLKKGEPYILPEGARATRFDANNNPIAYEFEGETYYPPGSLPFESGFRTESERVQYGGAHTEGVHYGSLVREDSVIVVDDAGNPVARYGRDELDNGNLDAQLRMGLVRFPVKDDIGREVLLTEKEFNRMAGAKDDSGRLDVAKDLKLIPMSMTLKEFTGEMDRERNAKVAAGEFEYKQYLNRTAELPDGNRVDKAELFKIHEEYPQLFDVMTKKGYRGERGLEAARLWVEDNNADIAVKNIEIALQNARANRQNAAIRTLESFTGSRSKLGGRLWVDDEKPQLGPPGIDVLGFIRATDKDKAEQTLIDAGYDLKDIKEWQRTVTDPRYLNTVFDAAVEEKRNELFKTVKPQFGESSVPGGEDNSAYELYFNRVSGMAGVEVAKQFNKDEILTILKEKGIQGANADIQRVLAGAGVAGKISPLAWALLSGAASGGVTATHWAYMTTPEKVIAVGEDVAVTAAMLWGGKILSPVIKGSIEGGSGALSKLASETARLERLAARAGKEGSILREALTDYSKATAKFAEAVKPIKMSAVEAGKAAKTTEVLKAAETKSELIGLVANGETATPIYQATAKSALYSAGTANRILAAEAASAKADKAFFAKLDKLRALSAKDLAELERRSGIRGLKDAISGVQKGVDEVEAGHRAVEKFPFFTDFDSPLKGQPLVDAIAEKYSLESKPTARISLWKRWVTEANIEGQYHPETSRIKLKNWGGTKDQNLTILHELSHPKMESHTSPATVRSLSNAAEIGDNRIFLSGTKKGLLTRQTDELARGVASSFDELSTIEYVKRISGIEDAGYRKLILDRLELLGNKYKIKNLPSKIDRIAQNHVSSARPEFMGDIPVIGDLSPAKLEANNRYILRQNELLNAQVKLQEALERADSTLKPRYTKRTPYAGWETPIREQESEIARLRSSYNKAKSAYDDTGFQSRKDEMLAIQQDLESAQMKLAEMEKARIRGDFPPDIGRETVGDIEKYLKSDKGTPKPDSKIREEQERLSKESRANYEAEQRKAATALKEREAEIAKKAEEFRKPLPEPVNPRPELKPSDLPKVAKEATTAPAFGMTPKPKEGLMASEKELPREDYGRMTPEQAARYEPQSGETLKVRSTTIEQALIRTGQYQQVTPKEWQQIRELIHEGVIAQQQAITRGDSLIQQEASIRDALKDGLKDKLQNQTQMQTQLLQQTIAKQIEKTPPKKPPPPLKEPIKPPKGPGPGLFPRKSSTDEEKRASILAAGGAVAWPQGELGNKEPNDVWHVIKAPYRPLQDHLTLVGKPPEGAKLYKGAKEAYKSITLLSGSGPARPVTVNSGAIDPTVYTTSDGRVEIKFTKDPETRKRYSKKYSKKRNLPRRGRTRQSDLAPDVVITGGRQHIKIR